MRRRSVHGISLDCRAYVSLTWVINRNTKMLRIKTLRGIREKSRRCTTVIWPRVPRPLALLDLVQSPKAWPFGLRFVRQLECEASMAHETVSSSFIVRINSNCSKSNPCISLLAALEQCDLSLILVFYGLWRYSLLPCNNSTVGCLTGALPSTLGFPALFIRWF